LIFLFEKNILKEILHYIFSSNMLLLQSSNIISQNTEEETPVDNLDNFIFSSTPYRISTITATGCINTEISLKKLFESIDVIDKDDNKKGIVYLEYGKDKCESITKGENVKKKVKSRKQKQIKRFDNQATAVIKIFEEKSNYVNMKLFKNGNIQMTGIKGITDGNNCIDIIVDLIKEKALNDIAIEPEKLMRSNYKVQLINSDFKVNLEIKRDILYKLLIYEYDIACSYEPCIYPGVKIQYFWNDDRDGKCKCENHCSKIKKNSVCKKITIAVFQSGCIIITGANIIEQVEDTYKFICNILKENIKKLYKKTLKELLESANIYKTDNSQSEIILINKKNIVNPERICTKLRLTQF
jgi:TATA-box binding protein (TBP) (component of TFIID and TFIIIB)